MDDDGAADTDGHSQRTAGEPRDGLINFAAYSLAQLRELKDCVDRRAFPENCRNLLTELQLKETQAASVPVGDAYQGRFSLRTGLLGWLRAKIQRSPVYGVGSIELRASEIILNGWQRTWLGVPLQAQVVCEAANIRNVVEDGSGISFEIRRKYLPAYRVWFQAESSEQAGQLFERLPDVKSEGFLKHWAAIRDFSEKLRAVSGTPWLTPLIVALNVAVFAAMAVATKKFGQFTPQDLLNWGANFGPLTVNGQWWRLFTALFVHLSLLHVSLNMWALWNVGRLSERLFGHATLSVLYVLAGLLAGLTSIAWDPSHSSVGASGAIFGLFGAFLAFLIRQRRQIPATIVLRHWISTLAFVLFNLGSNAMQPGIDNAAHVGGVLSGFVLGFILARPLDSEQRSRFPLQRTLVATAFTTTVVLAAVWHARGIGSGLTTPERYFRGHSAYVSGEAKNLQLWGELAERASAGSISEAELAQRFETEILPFWQTQRKQLTKEDAALKEPDRAYALLVQDFVEARYEWASALLDAAKNHDSARSADAGKLMLQTNLIQARLERIGIRARMDHRPRALAAAPVVAKIRQLLDGRRSCVTAPSWSDAPIAESDDKHDGPAARHALGCQAQQLFMAGDYERLDSLMSQSMELLADLPDGSSRYEGVVRGLADLFRFGGLSSEVAFGHAADWRREVNMSPMADLAEAMAFSEWAWSARGNGFANSISNQNLALYSYRTEMAAAALADAADRASNNPLWYTLSLEIGLDQGKDRQALRGIFDRGIVRTPMYRPLYRRMLRILMPRWGGSYREVDEFINQMQARARSKRGSELYAELYAAYAQMEGDDLDLFADTQANWNDMKRGYLEMIRSYPTSDSVLNNFANIACRAGDRSEYKDLRSSLTTRFSSSSWSTKYSIDSCDIKFAGTAIPPETRVAQTAPEEIIESLGGVRLGMTQSELLAAKGSPIHQEKGYWVYNTVDSKHNGVLTAAFTPAGGELPLAVATIEYTGDQASAPKELPYLNQLSSVQIIEMYGEQVSGRLTLTGPMSFFFRNGVYVDTLDEKVYRYGIYRAKRQ